MQKEIDDILLVGAGLTGLAFCNLLKDTKIKISIIDIHSKEFYNDVNIDRYIVLSNTSKIILQSMGLWDNIQQYCSKVKNIHISKKNIFGSAIVRSEDENLESLGYQIPVTNLINILYKNIKNSKNINFIYKSTVNRIEKGEAVKIHYVCEEKEKEHFSKSIIFSSGSIDSLINPFFKNKIEKDYQQNAVTCEITTNKYNSDTAYERFTSNGVLGVIPRKKNVWTLIYSVDNRETNIIKKLNTNEAIDYFQDLLGSKCGLFKEVKNIKSYPLKLSYYRNFTKENMCLLGDAAHTLHPIAAQSFNLSLRDCAYLTSIIKNDKLNKKNDFSEIFSIYFDNRKKEMNRLVRFTDVLASFLHGKGIIQNKILGFILLFMDTNKNARVNIIRYLLGVNFSQSLLSTLKE
ncbi:MAG: hypothetical protein HN613_00365 [Gammaproteobacteria bacterium]|jgi:2-octaprenyl-6-methoxyphenol hydroxylase|nr:hypothetical protein [Gammaproteobacteria bacterium]MBT7602982.1 hypothetical protein [Gammaproteobacteria bacterium]